MVSGTGFIQEWGQFLSEEIVSGGTTITYIGQCSIKLDRSKSNITTLGGEAIWSIQKITETVSGGTTSTVQEFPIDSEWRKSTAFEFIRDDRATLTYL